MADINDIKEWIANALGTETYDGDINEYINWDTGVNELTGIRPSSIPENAKISGGAIRRLIQSKLKTPFVTEIDNISGKINFFSSEATKNMWKAYRELGDEESLEKADSLIIYNMDLPATYRITGLDSFVAARYIIDGNSTSVNGKLDLELGIEDALGSPDADVLTVAYTITDNTGNIQYSSSDLIETNRRVVKDIYNYLRAGENKVEISVSANNHNVRTNRHFSIYLVTFSISSDFTGFYNSLANNNPINFNIFINRSVTNLPVTTKVYIDGTLAKQTDANLSDAQWVYSESSANPTVRASILNSYLPSDNSTFRKHTMKIVATMTDGELGNNFESNNLIYNFEIAPSTDDLTNSYVNLVLSVASGTYSDADFEDIDGQIRHFPIIKATLYLPITLDWGYNTDSFSLFQEANIQWAIRTGILNNYTYESIATILATKGTKPESLTFIPSTAKSYEGDGAYLVARVQRGGELISLASYPILIDATSLTVSETTNYTLKLSAYGKTNTSSTKNQWVDDANNVTTYFSPGVTFDSSNGWNENSLILKGTDSYARINYCPFPSEYNGVPYSISNNGATFEIDFKPEYISSEDDILITIGNPNKPHIRIKATSAGYYTGSSESSAIVKTNYKAGERIKLAFIFNPESITNTSNLVFIVNNGILERTAAKGTAILTDDSGNIKIGGSNSSVRVYMIRAYRQSITPKNTLDNYMFDNPSDVKLISRNDIYGSSSEINYTSMEGKQDLITIEGNLTNILSNRDTKENATVNITRESHLDSNRNFTILNCRIRNHGQSTLSYPITSMKMWFNKSNKFDEATGKIEIMPTFNCQNQVHLGLNKNRYVMKSGAIPSNKFVLQANYADSSGTHNGSLLRLINDTWYNAKFGDPNNPEFKLRTAPQLFSSGAKITHNNTSIGEPLTGGWVEGVYNIPSDDAYYNAQYANKTWPEITTKAFPYQIRVAPDSFPCVVFYRDTSSSNTNLTLLGQYVFMDDKKSDFCFGERSIYLTDDLSDPFCLKSDNSKKDADANRVWDNSKVLQVEVVYPNSPLTSYLEKTIASKYILLEDDITGEETLVADPDAVIRRFDDVTATDANNNPTEYLWEQHFELIYPDKDDFTDKNGVFQSKKFALTILPFEDFLNWITDVAALRNTGNKLGISGALKYVTQAELDKFKAEAHLHLDLYKLAAYYVFFSRFGLVDSVERNALLKTYDGQHWHYEPWDMDIALGCANNGVIAYEPPISRNTKRANSESYVFAGRTANQSNVLWDCLECWDEWMNGIVHEVAQALYNAGLTYDNCIKMFDEEYVEKWSETLYNESGQYKYIEATNSPKYRAYLNGAKTSHRHWWLSNSMNYYDAKWECGDFTKNTISFRINKSSSVSNNNVVTLQPTQNTFFEIVYGAEGNQTPVGGGLKEATVGNSTSIDIQEALEDKQPCFIYGSTSIEKIDLSGLLKANGNSIGSYTDINFGGAYDSILGAPIKEIKLGAPCTPDIYTYPNETSYTSNLTVGENTITGILGGNDALENLEVLDVIGWNGRQSGEWLSNLMSENGHNRNNIKKLYALGCNIATEFATSTIGNNFEDLRLPDSITTLTFTNSSWLNISFWSYNSVQQGVATYNKHVSDVIPATINTVILRGTTGRNECALQLILDWINSIEATLPVNHNEEDLYDALSQKILIVDLAYWGTGNISITYQDVLRIAHFGGDGSTYPRKGYIRIAADGIGMTSNRVTYLQSLLGENVFNIGTTNNNLVVDYENDSIVISISGIKDSISSPNPLYFVDDLIWLKEPKSAKLSANHFLLSATDANNQLADNDLNNPAITANLTNNKYIWGFVESASAPLNSPMTTESTYAYLERGNDGIIRLRTREGDGNNYALHIRVVYGKIENNVLVAVMDTITVHLEAVTYPTSYNWLVYGQAGVAIQTFKYNNSIATTLFGNTIATQLQVRNYPDIYIFSRSGAQASQLEFTLTPSEPKYYIDSNTGNQLENWTANPDTQVIRYMVSELGSASAPSSNNLAYMLATDLALSENDPVPAPTFDIGLGTYLEAIKKATHGGIMLQAAIALPSFPVLYQVNAKVKIGGKPEETKVLYCMVLDDASPVVRGANTSMPTVLWNKYCDLYNLTAGSPLDMYHSNLLSIYGSLSFANESQLTSLITENNDSVLKYIPNVTSLDFSGCTGLTLVDGITNITNLDFSLSGNLQSLNLSGCTALNSSVINLAGCSTLTTLDTSDTTAGVILPTDTVITSLTLGSPTSLVINSPASLTASGVTITSATNLTDLQLIDVNDNSVNGFKVFGKIYNVN